MEKYKKISHVNKLIKSTVINTLLFSVTLFNIKALANVEPAALFTNNMVIQQQTNAAIWGKSDPKEKIAITASWGESVSTVADKLGYWQAILPTPTAQRGNPKSYSIEFKAKNTIVINNVQVGEVWLASGQSNMSYSIDRLNIARDQIGAANFPYIREFKVKKNASITPVDKVVGEWISANENSVLNFSGTAYFFAREIHQATGLPVGIVNASWGGTQIETWLAKDSQFNHKPTQKIKADFDRRALVFNAQESAKVYQEQLKKWQADKKSAEANGKLFSQRKPYLPEHPHLGKNYPSNLYNGMINPIKEYAVKGVIWYQGENNGTSAERGRFYQTQLMQLINDFRDDWNMPNLPFYVVQLANFKKAQSNPVEPNQYWPYVRESMRKVTDTLKHTGMVVTIDIGDANNIHPTNKMELGRRLSLLALKNEYNQDLVASGPSYQSAKINGNKVMLTFSEVGSGLTTDDGQPLAGFVMENRNGEYIWADAKIIPGIKNNTQQVEVSSPKVNKPKSIKYGWANNPNMLNLYNKEGLPASPFSTN
jgi:sialate O-acetylesterase